MFLRQHTATTVQMGPYLNFSDGNTELATLTLTASSVFFMKQGLAPALGTSTATLAGGTLGWFTLSLASSNVDTAGPLNIYQHATAAIPVWMRWTVLPQQVFDSLITATDLLDISVVQINGNTVTATGSLFGANVTAINGNAVTATGTLFPADIIQYTHQALATATGSLITTDVTQVSHLAPETSTTLTSAIVAKATAGSVAGTVGQALDTINVNLTTGRIANLDNISQDTKTACDLSIDGKVDDIALNVWTYVVEGAFTAVNILRGVASVLMGNVTGGPSNTSFKKISDANAERLQGVSDSSGDRSTIVYTDLT